MAVIEPSKAFQQFNVVSQLPVLRQLGLMVGLAASIALGVGIIFWAQEPVYKPLYGNLSEMDASQVINQLELCCRCPEPIFASGSGFNINLWAVLADVCFE